jgi:hypothetical protein
MGKMKVGGYKYHIRIYPLSHILGPGATKWGIL